jgi:hypothetical protein
VAGGDDLGEALGEIVLPAPVHGGAVAVEQPQLRQRVHTGRQPPITSPPRASCLSAAASGAIAGSGSSASRNPLAFSSLPGLPGRPSHPLGGLLGLQETGS